MHSIAFFSDVGSQQGWPPHLCKFSCLLTAPNPAPVCAKWKHLNANSGALRKQVLIHYMHEENLCESKVYLLILPIVYKPTWIPRNGCTGTSSEYLAAFSPPTECALCTHVCNVQEFSYCPPQNACIHITYASQRFSINPMANCDS